MGASRPLIFARVKQHKAADQSQDEMLKFIVYNMEISRTLFPLASGIETASVGECALSLSLSVFPTLVRVVCSCHAIPRREDLSRLTNTLFMTLDADCIVNPQSST
jgi:hypothetical protein